MEDFPFNFNLRYKKEEDYVINPPSSLFKLKEIVSNKYNTKIKEMVYIPENDEKIVINNEQDYLDLIQYVSDHNLTEAIIYINREKDEENEEKEEDNKEEEEEKEDERQNKKEGKKGKNKKHNKGVKEQKRIGYIIEKKQMQRDESLKEEEEKKQKKINN